MKRLVGWLRLSEGLAAGGAASLAVASAWKHYGAWGLRLTHRLPPHVGRTWATYLVYVLVLVTALAGLALGRIGFRVAQRRHARVASALGPVLVGAAVVAGAFESTLVAVGAALASLAIAVCATPWARADIPDTDGLLTRAAWIGASEAACLALGVSFPFMGTSPGLALLAMGASAVAAAAWIATRPADDAWRFATCGLPLLLAPFGGLAREPTFRLPVTLALACVALFVATSSAPRVARAAGAMRALTGWTRAHAFPFALTGMTLVLVIPFAFRDLPTADLHGHEAQHYGWINSLTFGKLMFADAGFIYGPLREYGLALTAWALGGITLEHIRVAHVLANVGGQVLLFAALWEASRRRIVVTLPLMALALTHTPLVSMVNYPDTYSFGWADSVRMGLPCFTLVMLFGQHARSAAKPNRRRLVLIGALLGASVLYSHDFGTLAVISASVGLGALAFDRGRAPKTIKQSFASVGAGLGAVVGVFVLAYVVCGRGKELLEALSWIGTVAAGGAPYGFAKFPVTHATFEAAHDLWTPIEVDGRLGTSPLDFLTGPAASLLGLTRAAMALPDRWSRRTSLVVALVCMEGGAQRHVFMTADAWHAAGAMTPALVLVATLLGDAPAALAFGRRRIDLALGILLFLCGVWFYAGAAVPVQARIGKLATGAERPSHGPAYRHDDIPRAGDVLIPADTAKVVHYIQSHTTIDEGVFSTTWELGGGTEAFLAHRRNPTSFDVPAEVIGKHERERVLRELRAHPPKLIVGTYFTLLGDDAHDFISHGWDPAPGAPIPMWVRRDR